MLEISEHIGQGFGKGELKDILDELQLFCGGVVAGEVYFVDNNAGDDGYDGLSWDKAKKTLASAITASNAYIAAGATGWAARNTIFYKADRETATLVEFPDKCDVIGVGSCDAYIGAGILGNHAPVETGNYGTRFINVNFFPAASGDIITLTNASSGIEFHNCTFIGVWSGATAPSAIDITASPQCIISKCRFLGAFSGDVIDIGAGDVSGMKIVDNEIIGGADNGIMVTGTATAAGVMSRGLVARNFIQVADIVIDCNATSVFDMVDNKCISGESSGSSSYVIDETYAVNNILTCADTCIIIPTYSELTTA